MAVQDKTSLFIAHRLSTILDAKEIFVLGEGGVVESGTHAQLITAPNSIYAELWAKQMLVNTTAQTQDLVVEEK